MTLSDLEGHFSSSKPFQLSFIGKQALDVLTTICVYVTRSLVHFARLANTLLKDGESTQDSHVLAGNFAKYSPILNKFHSRTQQ